MAFMVPVEFESRTEKDSRIEWSRGGGSLVRMSVWLVWLFGVLEATVRIEKGLAIGELVAPRVVGEGGGSVCERSGGWGLDCGPELVLELAASSSS